MSYLIKANTATKRLIKPFILRRVRFILYVFEERTVWEKIKHFRNKKTRRVHSLLLCIIGVSQRGGIHPHSRRRSIKKRAARAAFSPLLPSVSVLGEISFSAAFISTKPTKQTKVNINIRLKRLFKTVRYLRRREGVDFSINSSSFI